MSDKVKKALSQYFIGDAPFKHLGLDALKHNYLWAIPKCDFLEMQAAQCAFQANVELKHKLAKAWKGANNEQRFEIAKWVVKDWGGIRGNCDKTLQRFVSNMECDKFTTPLQGIASFSKILAASNPQFFAIYDARVAVSLNSIQFLLNVRKGGLAFPYLPGRNQIVGDSTHKRGFAYCDAFSIKRLVEYRQWEKVEKGEAYDRYCSLLKEISNKLSGTKRPNLWDLEMALFADAEKLACMAMEKIRSNKSSTKAI